MLLGPPLTGTKLSPVAPRSWALPSGHFPGNVPNSGLNQVRVSGAVCASTPGLSDSRASHVPTSQKFLRWGDSNPCQLRNVIQSTALEALERARRQHQDWFDENDADLSNVLVEKNGLHKATKAAFFRCCHLAQQRLREMQDTWMVRKAEKIMGGISLLNIAEEIFASILLNHLNAHLEQGLLAESQCGFRRHRTTSDVIFATKQLQEKCQKMRTHLYTTFVDLAKAFDTVNRNGLCKIMQNLAVLNG
ncbi:unnamed protein product [Schistocephalus solidus]|uniref:Reverse transcriptase domain-containing protein n=1 Tax=Schistocephalus solidus TaxID=70667 RepID=A0A183SIN1_SCHSO|nr:unnamed protein product [Schistocephalus solidus]